MSIGRAVFGGSVIVLTLLGSCTALVSANIVDEGNVGIVKVLGEAETQLEPGFHWVQPFIASVHEMEVRERRTTEELAASTANQLPITAVVSVNWTITKTAALDLFKKYGSLDQFGDRILEPRLRQAAKEGLAKFQADELIRDRGGAANRVQEILTEEVAGYPVTISSLQIENVSLPQRYMEAVLAKEQAREDAQREHFNLERQKLEAQREVQTAEAERDAAKARADGTAYASLKQAEAEAEGNLLRAEAEAKGLREIANALSLNPQLVELEKAKRWNGTLPQTILGDSPNLLMSMGAK